MPGPDVVPAVILVTVSFVPADCEHLLRKMLVLEPSRRYTIKQVKRHRWTQTEPPAPAAPTESRSGLRAERTTEPNEQVLRIMQELGIDVARTREVFWGQRARISRWD